LTLGDLFAATFAERPSAPALEWQPEGGVRTTLAFGEVERRARRMARVLADRGVTAGDRVAVQVGNCPGFIDLFLACLRLGAILVPVNVLYRAREIAHILGDAEPARTSHRDTGGLGREFRCPSPHVAAP
jgi:acyl-CoA synthetase (AMP-forming)/AMP-acid ligase II